jgi:hypothetical protein
VVHEGLLDFALAARIGCAEKVEKIGILKHLRGHIGIGGRQGQGEVVYGLALPFVGAAIDHLSEQISGPAVLNRGFDVPKAYGGVRYPVQKEAIVEPWNLCSKLLHNVPHPAKPRQTPAYT